MLRFLVETVIITQHDNHIHLSIRFKTGTVKELDIERGKRSFETWRTPPEALGIIEQCLSDFKTSPEIADTLNERGLKSGKGLPYTRQLVTSIINFNNLKSLEERFAEMGYIPQKDIMELTALSGKAIKKLRDEHIVQDYKTSAAMKYWYKLEDFKQHLTS